MRPLRLTSNNESGEVISAGLGGADPAAPRRETTALLEATDQLKRDLPVSSGFPMPGEGFEPSPPRGDLV